MMKSILRRSCLTLTILLISLPIPGRAAERFNTVLSPHAQDLVILKGDQWVPFKADPFLEAPYTVLYFGAGWCPDCRRFSPSLVSAYNQQKPGGSRFEVLLLSVDKSAEGLLKYMQSEKMPWPALAFEKIAGAGDLKKFYSGHGYPCLTVIDSKGSILLQSKSDLDAKEILGQLLALVDPSAAGPGKTSP
jgi:thiol-disulfide isomerase/thioredoxin